LNEIDSKIYGKKSRRIEKALRRSERMLIQVLRSKNNKLLAEKV